MMMVMMMMMMVVNGDDDGINGDDDGDYLAMITDESPGSSTAKSRMKSKGSINCLRQYYDS